jgi:hypothetical protein
LYIQKHNSLLRKKEKVDIFYAVMVKSMREHKNDF